MPSSIVDLRSDTVTRPTPAMRAAMAEAEVGDDVYGEDPSVNALEAEGAARLGKPAALFLSSATQANLVAVLAHCGRGEEAIVGRGYHVYAWEARGASVLGGVALEPIEVAQDGALEPERVLAAVKADDPHLPISRLLVLENTHAGRAIALPRLEAAATAARGRGLAVHLDGSRLMNAAAASDLAPAAIAATADSVTLCLSKGLGAPAGALLAGEPATIARARRLRKMLGGGMRQAGVLAAAGRHALAHHVARLAEDHDRAAMLARQIRKNAGLAVSPAYTNMTFVRPLDGDGARLAAHCAAQGVRIADGDGGPIRLVTHLDVDDEGLGRAIEALRSYEPA